MLPVFDAPALQARGGRPRHLHSTGRVYVGSIKGEFETVMEVEMKTSVSGLGEHVAVCVVAGPPPPPLTYPLVVACYCVPLLQIIGTGMPHIKSLLQRCLSHSREFCYKPMSWNGCPSLLRACDLQPYGVKRGYRALMRLEKEMETT